MRSKRCLLFATLWICALSLPAYADDDPQLTIFVGSGHGADAQLHPALSPINCYDCKPLEVPRYSFATAPSLATFAVGYVGNKGMVRGGLEGFTVVTVGAVETAAYAGGLTFAGVDQGRLFGLIGFGLGKFISTHHRDTLSSFALNARAELGVHLLRGWSVSARADVIYNNISSSRVVSFGLSWTPSRWTPSRFAHH